MNDKADKQVANRREFLKRTGIVAGAAAVGATQTTQAAGLTERPAEVSQSGYQESEHVKTYYELARF